MTTILLPVSPKEAMNILNGDQTIIVRKSVPKEKLPIKVCLYCSDSKDFLLDKDRNYFMWDKHGHHYFYKYDGEPKEHYFQKKVVGSFELRKVEEVLSESQDTYNGDYDEVFFTESVNPEELLNESRMEQGEISDLGKCHALYVSDLKAFKEPKKPSEFKYRKKYRGCKRCPYGNTYNPASDFSVCYTCSELLKVTMVRGAYMYVEEDE